MTPYDTHLTCVRCYQQSSQPYLELRLDWSVLVPPNGPGTGIQKLYLSGSGVFWIAKPASWHWCPVSTLFQSFSLPILFSPLGPTMRDESVAVDCRWWIYVLLCTIIPLKQI